MIAKASALCRMNTFPLRISNSTVFYVIGLLEEERAISLFCFCVFEFNVVLYYVKLSRSHRSLSNILSFDGH